MASQPPLPPIFFSRSLPQGTSCVGLTVDTRSPFPSSLFLVPLSHCFFVFFTSPHINGQTVFPKVGLSPFPFLSYRTLITISDATPSHTDHPWLLRRCSMITRIRRAFSIASPHLVLHPKCKLFDSLFSGFFYLFDLRFFSPPPRSFLLTNDRRSLGWAARGHSRLPPRDFLRFLPSVPTKRRHRGLRLRLPCEIVHAGQRDPPLSFFKPRRLLLIEQASFAFPFSRMFSKIPSFPEVSDDPPGDVERWASLPCRGCGSVSPRTSSFT